MLVHYKGGIKMKKTIIILMSILVIVAFTLSGCSQTGVAPTEEELSLDATSLVQKLVDNDFKGAKGDHQYSFIMWLLTGQKTMSILWESITASYGDFIDIYGYQYKGLKGYDNIYVNIAFTKKCVNFQVTYKKGTKKIAGLHYAPNSDKPTLHGAPKVEVPEGLKETTFTFGVNGLELPAILTTPEKEGTYPAVILVHGSGPNDADETVGNQTPFRDIAWGLAKRGIAVMRYDKRTLVHPESFDDESTVQQETIEDAMMAAITLQSFKEVDMNKIYILGHSLGGMLIPRIYAVTPEAYGFIMMAAPITPLHELMIEQYEYIFDLDGKKSINEWFNLRNSKKMRDNVNSLTDESTIEKKKLFNISKNYWLDLKGYDVAKSADAIEKPLLILQGESDYQVPMRDFNALQDTLSEKENVTMISYKGLGHLMTTAGETPAPSDYNDELHVDEKVIEDIAQFINNN